MKRGYQQVAVSKRARKYLGAQWGSQTVASTVLPFGLNLSPYVFTRITSWLAREIRKKFDLRVAVYVDDFLLGADSKEKLQQGIKEVETFFNTLGVILSEKTTRLPAKRVEFLGFLWDAGTKEVSVTGPRRKEYRREVRNLLRHTQAPSVWRKVVGKLLFLQEAVGHSLRHLRSLMHALRGARKGSLLAAEGEAREDLSWWEVKLRTIPRLSLMEQPVSAVITTDASEKTLAAVVEVFGETQDKENRTTMSTSTRSSRLHINAKEIEALLEALKKNKESLQNKKVLWFTDNRTARAAIARQGTQHLSSATWDITKEVLDLAANNKVKIIPRHVPGRLNGGADLLSRPSEEVGEWERALSKVCLDWGPLEEDPCGLTRDPTSILEGLQWASKRTLIAPHIRRLGETITLLAQVATKEVRNTPPSSWEQMAVVLTPLWKGSTWWPLLREIRVAWQPLGRLHHPELKRWEARNGHPSEWTASLVPTRMPSGRQEQSMDIGTSSGDSSFGCGTTPTREI